MFTKSERETFAAHGLIKRSNFLPPAKLTKARAVIFQFLEEVGIWRDGDWVLDGSVAGITPDSGMKLIKPLNRHPTLTELIGEEVLAAATALADDRPLFPMEQHPGLLFTLPNAATWTLPAKNWHLDMPRLPDGGTPGVQIFTFLETVATGGGGTLAVTGSHRLRNEKGVRTSSGDLRKQLLKERYFAELMTDHGDDRHHFLHKAGQVGGVPLQVVEMTGDPGDIYFMDLRVLHNVAPNALAIPRIMLTQRYLLDGARVALYGR